MTLKKKILLWFTKILAAVIAFSVIFVALNSIVAPKFYLDSTSIVDGYSVLPSNDVDVLFLGASQMFCGIDAQKLNEEYEISSYDYGASNQPLPISYYYLKEALKTQHPKTVVVEVCQIFSDLSNPQENMMAWSYAPMKPSFEKWESLCRVLKNNYTAALSYFIPIFQYHSEWTQFKWWENISHIWKDKAYPSRGFLARDAITPVKLKYYEESSGEKFEIPDENIDAIFDIAELCKENHAELLFIKVPVSTWSKDESYAVKQFMDKNGLNYFEMNDFLDEIGINENKDFYNETHLNTQGAGKTTDFLAEYLLEKK